MTKLACNAAARGDVAELQRLFGAGGPLHKRPSAGTDPETGETPLHAAARGKRLEALKWLLNESGLDPQTRAKNGETAAHLAAFEGWLAGLEVLVEHDPQRRTLMITDKDLQGLNPLHVAIIRGQELVVQWVISNFSAERLRLTEKGSLAVHYAAAAGRMGILRLVAEHIGTNAANAPDDNNATPVYFAAQDGQLEAIKFMITECGADPKAKTTDGMQALHAATQNGHEEVVQWLVARIGRTALMETTDDGATAVHFAAAAGHVSLLRWFFSTPNGSSLALVKDNMHSTPLHDAIDYGHMDCLKLILSHGGDLFANDLDGVSPYSLAMECGEEMEAFVLHYVQDKHLVIPAVLGRKHAGMAKSGHVSHPTIPRSHGDDAGGGGNDAVHPAIPKGSGFGGGGGGFGIRTRMTESEEIQAAQQQVMAHRLTSAREASAGAAPVKDSRTRPMRQTSFRDLKPAAPFLPPPPVPPPPDLDDLDGASSPARPSSSSPKKATGAQPDGRPSPDGQEKGPLSQEVNGWFSSPSAEAAAEATSQAGGGVPTTPTGDAPPGERRRKRGGQQRSKRRKLQQQVPHYQYMPVYRPVMTPYGYMLTQTVMPVPVMPGAAGPAAAAAADGGAGSIAVGGGPSRRRKQPSGRNKARSPQGSGPSSPMALDSGSESGGGGGGAGIFGYVAPDRRNMKRKDSGRLPLSAQQQAKSPSAIAAMKSLASVNEEFAEEDEDEEEENGTTARTPTAEASVTRQRRQSMTSFSQSLSAMNTLGQSPASMPMSSSFSPYAQQHQQLQQQQLQATLPPQSPAKQAGFLRWLFNAPPATTTSLPAKGLWGTGSTTAMGDYIPYAGRRGSLPAGAHRTRAPSVSSMDAAMGQDFMIGLDEQSYQHGSTLVAMALCTSVIGMSIVSAVPRKSIVPMLAAAARRAVANFSVGADSGGGGGGGAQDGKQRRRESRTTVETTGSNDTTATQRGGSKGDEQAKGGAGNKLGRQLSRKISLRRAASTPELDKEAKEARRSSVWEFDMKMESRASTRWGSDESSPVDVERIASLQRQGPKRDEQAERAARQEREEKEQQAAEEKERREREERRLKEDAAERARIAAEEEYERRAEEKAIRDAAKRAKQDEERRKREQREEEARRKKSEDRQHRDDSLRRRQDEQLQRKQSKQDVKQADEQRRLDLAAKKLSDAEEQRSRAQAEKEAEKQRKIDEKKGKEEVKDAEKQRKMDEKKRKEEEKERRREADREVKKRHADDKRRKKEEQQLLKEDQARRRKTSKDEAKKMKNKNKRTLTASLDEADAGQTKKFLGQWESDIKMQTGDLSAVLDDLQATIDLDTDISAMYGGGGDSRIEEDTGVSELALALQLSGQAEMLSETMVYEENEEDGQVEWQSSAAFEASAAGAILSTDGALDDIARRPSLSSANERKQPSRGQLGRSESDAIPEAPPPQEQEQAPSEGLLSPAMVPPPPAAPPNLMGAMEKEDQVGFLETSAVKPSQARKIWQQRSNASVDDSSISQSGSSTALHSMLSNSKTDLSGGRRPGSAGSGGGGGASAESGAGAASELEYALNQRRKKAQNDFLSNYRKSVDRPM